MDGPKSRSSVTWLLVWGALGWGFIVAASTAFPFTMVGLLAFIFFPLGLVFVQLANGRLARLHAEPAAARASRGLMLLASLCAIAAAPMWGIEVAAHALAARRGIAADPIALSTLLVGSLGPVGAALYGIALRKAPAAGWGHRWGVPLAALLLSPAAALGVYLLRHTFPLTA